MMLMTVFNTGTIIFITSERVPLMEYLSMMVPTQIAFILRSPPISYVSNIYYLPFTGKVWISSIMLVVVCIFVIALTLKMRWSPDEETENMTSSDFFLFAISSSCQMGNEYLTRILSTRISMVDIQYINP